MPDRGQLPHEHVRTPSPRERNEAATVRRAQFGSTNAFDEIVRTRGPDLYRYLLLRLGNESDARDALQESITDAWKGFHKLNDPENCWPWLVTIAKRKAMAVYHKNKRRRVADVDLDLLPGPNESALEVWDAIGRLRPIHREVIVIRYLLGLSEKEAAHVLGVRVGTVKTRSFVARQTLKELLT